MKIVNNFKVTAAAAVFVLVAAACGAAEVSGGGSADSAISSRGKISIAIETKGLCVKGTERECDQFPYGGRIQLVRGEFKDSGTSAVWPYGVSMKFEGRFGDYPKDLAQSNAMTNCRPGLTCWTGIVGYQSTDERHYPNVTSTDCTGSDSGAAVIKSQLIDGEERENTDSRFAAALAEGLSRFQARDDSTHSDRGNSVTGLAFVLIIDTNRNGEIDSGEGSRRERDQFLLQSICGPYSNQPGLTELDEPFSYATCALTGGTIVGLDPFYIAYECPSTLRSGDLKIKMLPPTTTTSTTTTTTTPLPN